MKDHNLLKQKLALIASSGVLADTVVSALDDACSLLDEYKAEIDKRRQPEIVRCKDCKWYDERISMCDNCGLPREQTFFCADGKRKEVE